MVIHRVNPAADPPEHIVARSEARGNAKFPPGVEVVRFPASLSNWQGYPKSGSMGITFLVSFEHIEDAMALTKLTGLEFLLIAQRPERRYSVEEQAERDEQGLDGDWDDLARRFE